MLSDLPSFCESILGVTVESVQGNQVYLKCIGTSGSFGMVARPLEFLSTFQLRPPPLEVRQECWNLPGASTGNPTHGKSHEVKGSDRHRRVRP